VLTRKFRRAERVWNSHPVRTIKKRSSETDGEDSVRVFKEPKRAYGKGGSEAAEHPWLSGRKGTW